MSLQPVRTCIYVAALCAPLLAFAAPPVLVTSTDYQIGAEGLPDTGKTAQHSPSATGVQVKRQLVSLYGGESGDSIPARGYLTDVVWGEQTLYPAEPGESGPTSAERIIYYSFNVGVWRHKLDSETSVLTRAFMTQPLLIFLPDADKAEVAEQLSATPLFRKAVAWHKRHLTNPASGTALLDDAVLALGEQGVARLSAAQKQGSGQVFQERIAQKTAQFSGITGQSEIDFDNPYATFNVFKGMDISGKADEQLEFTSYSSLYYGVQELGNFQNVKGGFWQRADRHFFNVPLIEPVTGWWDKDLLKKTPLGLADIKNTLGLSPLKAVGGSAQVALFRNNPYTALDAPMAMNLMTAGVVMAEILGNSAATFKPAAMTGFMENVKKFSNQYTPYFENIAVGYVLAKSIKNAYCTATEQKEGVCGDYDKKIDQVAQLLAMFKIPIATIEQTLKDGAKDQTFDAKRFCGEAVLALFAERPRKTNSPLYKNPKASTKLAICTFDKLVTQKLLGLVAQHLPADYQRIENAKYTSIQITAEFFKNSGWAINSGHLPSEFRLEFLLARLRLHNIQPKELLGLASQVMDIGADTINFVRGVQNGDVQFMPLFRQLYDALQDHLIAQGNAYAANLIYDLFKALTPAKYAEMAYVLGNKGTALAWDWVTDPSVVKLTMTRTATNKLDISTAIPEMQGVRYLKVPKTAGNNLLDYSNGIQYANKMGADSLYTVSNAADTNQLLVYPNFQASVENQTVFANADIGTVDSLLGANAITMKWHVSKFANTAAVQTIPCTEGTKKGVYYPCLERTTANAFNKNNIDETVKDTWFPWTDPIIDLEPENPIHQAIYGDQPAGFSMLDFTQIYRKLMGDLPLIHKTPGIYSDYTHIKFKSGSDEKLYQNTFGVYVLPKLDAITDPATGIVRNLDKDLNLASRKYCEGDVCSEVQLNFCVSSGWDVIGKNGMWAVWLSANGDKLSEAVAVRTELNITCGSNTTLHIPPEVSPDDYLVIYEDVMHGYLQRAGKSAQEVLRKATTDRVLNNRYPLIAVPWANLERTDTPRLKAKDSDGDGVPDTLDKFPDDANYAHDSDNDKMPDEWETLYGLDLFVDDSNGDLDGDGISNLDEFKAKTDPRHLAVTATPGDKQVTLTWTPPLDTQSQGICWSAKTIVDAVHCLAAGNAPTTWLVNQTSPATVKKLTNGKPYYFAVVAENLDTGKTVASNVLTATPQKPFTINDTGIKTCSNANQNGLPCPVTGFPGQDAESGRDVSQNDPSNGHAGFNFTKISTTGAELPADAPSWNCVKDKVTGLMWEVKTDDGSLHDKDWYYTWYQPDASKNGGFAGYQNSGSCVGSGCDTHAYTLAVNTAGWCGFKDWRMPTVDELSGLASLDRYNPTIDTAYFPNTRTDWYWSSSPVANDSNDAWIVDFGYGYDYWGHKGGSYYYVRLVRGGQ